MTPWSAWEPELLPHVPGCPAIVARSEVRKAAQALLERSRAWQITLAPRPVSAGQDQVPIVVTDPSQQKLVRAEAAWLDGKRLDATTPAELDDSGTDDWQDRTGTPSHFFQLTPGVVSLYPKPVANAATGLKLRVSVMPADAADGLPDDLAVRYLDVIQSGARARLMLFAGKPWTNPAMATVYAGAFEAGVGQAKHDVAKAFGRGRIASRPAWC